MFPLKNLAHKRLTDSAVSSSKYCLILIMAEMYFVSELDNLNNNSNII